MKNNVLKLFVSLLFCAALLVCGLPVTGSAVSTGNAGEFRTWINLAQTMLSEEKTYISGEEEFIGALNAVMYSYYNEEYDLSTIAALKAAWGNLVYAKRTQFAEPVNGIYTVNSDDKFGTYIATAVSQQPSVAWMAKVTNDFWNDVISIDFTVSGYQTNNPSGKTDPNWSIIQAKNSEGNYISLRNQSSSFNIYQEFGSITPNPITVTVPVEYINNEFVYGNGTIEQFLFKLGENKGVSNTITVGSLFVTQKVHEVLPFDPAYADLTSDTVKYGSKVTVNVPDNINAYYTTDSSTPTVFSSKCSDKQVIELKGTDLRILSVSEDGRQEILVYNYELEHITRAQLLSEINKLSSGADDFESYTDLQLVAFVKETFPSLEKEADCFAAETCEKLSRNDYDDFCWRLGVNSENLPDTEVLETIKGFDPLELSPENILEREMLLSGFENSRKVFCDEFSNGKIVIDGVFAKAGDTVSLAVMPNENHSLKPGSLKVLCGNDKTIVPDRKDFRGNQSSSNEFGFVMPTGYNSVKVIAEFEEESSTIGFVDCTRIECDSDANDGLLFLYRCSKKEAVSSYGVLLASQSEMAKNSENELTLSFKGKHVKIDSRSDDFILYDKCNEYVDFSAEVSFSKNSANKSEKLISRAYAILADNTVVYSEPICCSYNDLANSFLSSNKNGGLMPGGNRNRIQSLKLENQVALCGEKQELSLDIVGLSGNVFASEEISLDAVFTSPTGKKINAIGFYSDYGYYDAKSDQEYFSGESGWCIRFVPDCQGTWMYELVLKENGTVSDTATGYIQVKGNNDYKGAVKAVGTRFFHENGDCYTPIGMNVCWAESCGEYLEYLKKISDHNGNYIRIWLSNLGLSIMSRNGTPSDFSYTYADASALDEIFDFAEKNGIYIQLVLFNHGQFLESGNDSSWNLFAYNRRNGGYLDSANDFWTNARAINDTKNYFRYIAARYGSSDHLLSYELCNEINYTNKATVNSWCEEMANYLHQIDKKHLVSVSVASINSNSLSVATNNVFDFINVHYYTDVMNSVIKTIEDLYEYGRPVLLSEVGYDFSQSTVSNAIFHSQNWMALMSGSAGGGMNWWWKENDSIKDENGQSSVYQNYDFMNEFIGNVSFDRSAYRLISKCNYTVSDSNAKVLGYCNSDSAYLWLYDKDVIDGNSRLHTVTNIDIPLGNGKYTVKVFNTVSGQVISEFSATAQNGRMAFAVKNWNSDVAISITKE